jgi:hypothetical protein
LISLTFDEAQQQDSRFTKQSGKKTDTHSAGGSQALLQLGYLGLSWKLVTQRSQFVKDLFRRILVSRLELDLRHVQFEKRRVGLLSDHLGL